jgi:PAS domain S-box-containing protein
MSEQSSVALQEENAALRQQITQLEATIAELRQFKTALDNAPDGVVIADMDSNLRYANQAFRELTNDGTQTPGDNISDYYTPEDLERLRHEMPETLRRTNRWQGEVQLRGPKGSNWTSQTTASMLHDEEHKPFGVVLTFRDVTQKQRDEQERLALQQQVIDAQQAALRELSTPLIPITDGLIAMPLVGAIDSTRAQQIMETLLEGIGELQAETAILDITGVKVVDTQVANALLRAAKAAQLLGAQVVLTGISAEVAQALVGLGADLGGVVTHSNLQSGISYALDQRPGALFAR